MQPVTYDLLESLSAVPKDSTGELKGIYEHAIEQGDLQFADYLTIRDLVKLSGYASFEIHLLLLCMFSSLNEGSVCMRLDPRSMARRIKRIAGVPGTDFAKAIISGVDNYPNLIYIEDGDHGLFGDPMQDFKPLIVAARGGERYVYFQRYHYHESAMIRNLARIKDRPELRRWEIGEIKRAYRHAVLDAPLVTETGPMELSREQRLSLILPLISGLVVISGGPGTGKTSIIINLIRIFLSLGVEADRIKVAAPTGRAMQRLNDSNARGLESITWKDGSDEGLRSIQAVTMHRLLQFSPSRNRFIYHGNNRIPADVIIIDEVSMVDVILMAKLLEAVEDGARLVFLGDRNQLPSVEAGSVLADMIPGEGTALYSNECIELAASVDASLVEHLKKSGRASLQTGMDRIVFLTENFRSDSGISEIAGLINMQDGSAVGSMRTIRIIRGRLNKDESAAAITNLAFDHDVFSANGVFRIIPSSNEGIKLREFHHLLDIWAEREFLWKRGSECYHDLVRQVSEADILSADEKFRGMMDRLFSHLTRSRILTPVRSGFAGTDGINSYLVRRIGLMMDASGSGYNFSGTPVIITRNDYARDLFNGDTGVILKGRDGHAYAVFRRGGGYISYPLEALPEHEPAYAITVHKSQGSEFGEVLFVLPEIRRESLVTKEILYTGITRAREHVLIYAAENTLKGAVKRKTDRESSLWLWD